MMEAGQPAEGEAIGTWWRRQADKILYCPETVLRHSSQYYVKAHCVTDADESEHVEIDSVTERRDRNKPGEAFPPFSAPEFACRPPLGIPSQELTPMLDLSPTEGPAGTILLRVRRIGRRPRASAPDAGEQSPYPVECRYWLDPARDYVVVRWDRLSGDAGHETVTGSTIIEELARSPQGIWYATRVRDKAALTRDGKTYDRMTHFDVDFNVRLSDSLFQPPRPGRILVPVDADGHGRGRRVGG